MASEEYKIIVKKNTEELVRLESELKVQRQKELDAAKTQNKILIEQEKQKTKTIEGEIKRLTAIIDSEAKKQTATIQAEGKKEVEQIKSDAKIKESEAKKTASIIVAEEKTKQEKIKGEAKIELEQFKTNEREKQRIAKETAKSQSEFDRSVTNAPRTDLGGGVGTLGYYQAQTRGLMELRKHLNPASQEFANLTTQIRSNQQTMRTWTGTNKMSALQLLEMGENITVVAAGLRSLVMPVMNFGKEVVMTAARTETLGVVVEQVGKVAGISKDQVNGYVDAVKQMGITTQVAREVITLMIQNQLDSARASELARVAQDAAVIADENSSQTLRGLIEAIVTRNSLMLRTRGIIIDVDRTITEHAKTLGKNKDALTESEKSQILLNAVIEKGADIAGTYEASMETAGKKVQSFERYVEEAKNEVGEQFIPVLNTGIDVATEFTKAIGGSGDAVKLTTGLIAGSGGMIPALVQLNLMSKIAGSSLLVMALGTAKALGVVAGSIAVVVFEFGGMIKAVFDLIDLINNFNKRVDEAHQNLINLGTALSVNPSTKFLGGILGLASDVATKIREMLNLVKEANKATIDNSIPGENIIQFDRFGNLIPPKSKYEVNRTDWRKDDIGAKISKDIGGIGKSGTQTAKEVDVITNSIDDLKKSIEDLQAKMNTVTDKENTLFRIYTDQIKELNKEIEKLSAKDTFLVRLKEYSDVLKNLSPALFKEQSTVSRRETIGLPETVEIGMSYQGQLKEQVKILQDSLNTFSGSFLLLFDMLNIKKDNFVYGMVKGFDTVLNTVGMIAKIIQSILNVNQSVGLISSLLSLIPGGNILGTIFGATSGGGGTSGAIGMNNQLNMAGASGMQSQKVVVVLEGSASQFFKVGRTEFYKNQTIVSLS